MRTADDLVRAEVHYCVSHLVSIMARGNDLSRRDNSAELVEACKQALELCTPIDDWEEAAIQEGWHEGDDAWFRAAYDDEPALRITAATAQEACERDNIEPYQREIFEHWIVSDWLADQLAERGEKVDKDFAGLTVWARTTTGQSIAMDAVIQAIAADLARA